MDDLKDLTYGIVGLGIMGGSIAKSIRANILDIAGAHGRILACNRSQAPLVAAKNDAVVDDVFPITQASDMVYQCDVVYVCLYPDVTLRFLKEHSSAFKQGSIVTDISGVKTKLAEGMNAGLEGGADFILGHPMAGGEKEGYINSRASFFAGRNYILMPRSYNKQQNIERLKSLITAMGFSRIVETDYRSHDRKIAFTSQLCHVIASALVQSAEDERITEFGGGSYEDLTRIAMINAPLWTELFIADKKELLGHIETFEKQLETIKGYLEHSDSDQLKAYLEKVRSRRMRMSRL